MEKKYGLFRFLLMLVVSCLLSCSKKDDVLVKVLEKKDGEITKKYINYEGQYVEGNQRSPYYDEDITFFKPVIITNLDSLNVGEKYFVKLKTSNFLESFGDSISFKFGGQQIKSVEGVACFSFNVSELSGDKKWQGSIEVFDDSLNLSFELQYYHNYYVK